jgi:hypothetical protein
MNQKKYGPTCSSRYHHINPCLQGIFSSWVTLPPLFHFSTNIDVGGGTRGISEFVDGLRHTAKTTGGKKEGQTHKRKQSGLPGLEGTLALGYTYIDVLDEENDGIPPPVNSD